jgi:hypothetical protein
MNIQPPRIWLPRTGQTTSYAAGDDGYFQAGNPRGGAAQASRFIDNLNGTISDRATGLQWVKEPQKIIPGATGVHSTNQIQVAHGNWANNHAYALAELCKDTDLSTYWVCVSAHTSAAAGTFAADRAGAAAGKWRQTVWTDSAADLGSPAAMFWPDAEGYALGSKWDGVNPLGAVGLTYAGFTDWRLPNILELFGITDNGRQSPCIDPTAFPNTKSNFYHSSTTRLSNTLHSYNVYFGTTAYINYVVKTTASWYVRPVRGGRLNANG